MNTMSIDSISLDGDAVAAIIRQTREHGKAERVLFTMTTPAGNTVLLTFQPTYDATTHSITLDNPISLVSPLSDAESSNRVARFPGPIALDLDAIGYPRP